TKLKGFLIHPGDKFLDTATEAIGNHNSSVVARHEQQAIEQVFQGIGLAMLNTEERTIRAQLINVVVDGRCDGNFLRWIAYFKGDHSRHQLGGAHGRDMLEWVVSVESDPCISIDQICRLSKHRWWGMIGVRWDDHDFMRVRLWLIYQYRCFYGRTPVQGRTRW